MSYIKFSHYYFKQTLVIILPIDEGLHLNPIIRWVERKNCDSQPAVNIEKIGPKKSIRKLIFFRGTKK